MRRTQESVWMQTTGMVLVAVRLCSVMHMWTLAHSSRSAQGLLYVVAVRDDRLPGPLLYDGQIGELRRAREPVGQHRPKDRLQPGTHELCPHIRSPMTFLAGLRHDCGEYRG